MGRVLGSSQPEIQGLEILGGFQDLPELVTVPKAGQDFQTCLPLLPWPSHHKQLSPSDGSPLQGEKDPWPGRAAPVLGLRHLGTALGSQSVPKKCGAVSDYARF